MMGDIAIRISDIHVTFGDHKVLKGGGNVFLLHLVLMPWRCALCFAT